MFKTESLGKFLYGEVMIAKARADELQANEDLLGLGNMDYIQPFALWSG